MYLPEEVLYCIQTLENAGFSAYAVGGCVRDALLGRTPQDYDLCTEATPSQICQLFSRHNLVLAGEKHGTIGVVIGHRVYEITTYRTEGSYADSRHPDWVEFVDTAEADLARRDFTVNAMAYSPTRGLCDPFGGRQDLQQGILRAVGDPILRFREDALRILRGVRFSARYGLIPEERTLQAMLTLRPLLDHLARERVFEEVSKLLLCTDAACLQRFAPILASAIPELTATIGFDQKNRHHCYDIFTHTAHVVACVPPTLPLRWAALLHDVGKPGCFSLDKQGQGHFYGHAQAGADMANEILLRLKAPTALREQVVTLIGYHMSPIVGERKSVRRWLSRLGIDTFEQLLLLQQADMGSKGTPADDYQFSQLRTLAQQLQSENACLTVRQLALSGHDLMALGYRGPAIGQAQRYLLDMVLEEKVENTAEALTTLLAAQQGGHHG